MFRSLFPLIALGACVSVSPLAAASAERGEVATQPRQIQIRSIDFDGQILELFNFGPTDVDLSGWRFCSHDFNEQLRYSSAGGLNGVTIESGTSIFVHFDNDAPGDDDDRINRSALGSFATPLDPDAYGIQIYFPGPNGLQFGDSTDIADHLQWNIDGQGVGNAERRTNQAVSEGLWSAIGDFIATEADSQSIELTDLSGDEAGDPSEYTVTGAQANDCLADFDLDGDVDLTDFGAFGAAFNSVVGDVNYDVRADFDGDDDVDLTDFGAFGLEFNRTDC